jgi:GMC oxidoreductase
MNTSRPCSAASNATTRSPPRTARTRGLHDGASQLGYSYRVATLNIDPEKYDPNLIGYSGMGDQTGAKGTMRTYLQDASDAGAKLLPNTWVNRIRHRRTRRRRRTRDARQ